MGATSATKIAQADAALDRMVEQDSHRTGRHHARLVGSGTHVWVIIATLHRLDGNVEAVARAFDNPVEAVQAAIRYYQRHQQLIDAQILLQNESFAG
ncbi:MAG TPA: hypothetical protein VGR16_14770 [Thermomicrobiales bacterium]|nr:hypothetical protein [Thermomicrobiales bacterium]